MDTKSLLAAIEESARAGSVSLAEITNAYERASAVTVSSSPDHASFFSFKKLDVSSVVSFIGIGIVFIGVLFLVFQHWDELGTFSRILITLGFSLSCYIAALGLYVSRRFEYAEFWIYLLFCLVFPIGMVVLFDSFSLLSADYTPSLISFCVLVFHILYGFATKRLAPFLFGLLMATYFFFAITDFFYSRSTFIIPDFSLYRLLFVSIAYLLLGYGVSHTVYLPLRSFIYKMGLIGLLFAIFALGGYRPDQVIFWEFIFPIIAVGLIAIGIFMKEQNFFVIPSFGIMIFVSKISFEYFSDSVGWPLTLIFTGLILVGLGISLIRFRKEYFLASS
ncbi:MAG: hypothetical protein RIQ54_204 [Candidatus Parcubacteria bacterium]|jgi:hypothetical protein